LQVPVLLDGDEVIAACRACGGRGYLVEDVEVFSVQMGLAREEGIFCEPAGAVSLAGALRAVRAREIALTDSVVCLITGVGFKDQQSVESMVRDIKCPMIDHLSLASFLS
jgi:threonine synthase